MSKLSLFNYILYIVKVYEHYFVNFTDSYKCTCILIFYFLFCRYVDDKVINRNLFHTNIWKAVIHSLEYFFLLGEGLTLLFNIWGHISTVPAGNSGPLTMVMPHRNAMPQTQDMAHHPVKVYRHTANCNMSLCYPLIWMSHWNTHLPIFSSIPWSPIAIIALASASSLAPASRCYDLMFTLFL